MMRLLIALAVLVLAAGCNAPRGAGYPSLLPRPIEKRGFAEPVPRAAPPATADPALDAEIAAKRGVLSKAGTVFTGKADEAERLAARAGKAAPGSEAWIAAQVALAELDTLRSGTAGALADIERLTIDRAADGKPPYPALQTLLAEARAQSGREAERIVRIEGAMHRA